MHVACLENPDGSLQIPLERDLLPAKDPWRAARNLAVILFQRTVGTPKRPAGALIRGLRKPVRLGDLYFYVSFMGPGVDYFAALTHCHAQLPAAGRAGRTVRFVSATDFVKRAADVDQALVGQWLVHWTERENRAAAFKPAADRTARSDSGCADTRDASTGHAMTLALDAHGSVRSILVHDGRHALFMRRQGGELSLPSTRAKPGEGGAETALRALEVQFGPVLTLDGHPRFANMIRRAVCSEPLLTHKGVEVYECHVEPFADWYSCFHVAFQMRKPTPTLARTTPDWHMLHFSDAPAAMDGSNRAPPTPNGVSLQSAPQPPTRQDTQ